MLPFFMNRDMRKGGLIGRSKLRQIDLQSQGTVLTRLQAKRHRIVGRGCVAADSTLKANHLQIQLPSQPDQNLPLISLKMSCRFGE